MQFFKRPVDAAHLVDEPLLHRLCPHQNGAQILGQHAGVQHHGLQLLLGRPAVPGDKRQDALGSLTVEY